MKRSINAWSIDRGADFEETFLEVKSAGFEGIELNVDALGHSKHSLTMQTEKSELIKIFDLSKKYTLPIISISSSLYMGKMGNGNPEDRAFSQELLGKQLEYASFFDAKGILVVPGGIDNTVSIKSAYENSFETLRQMKEKIAQSKIYVGVENVWNGFFLSPYDMCNFIDKLDCDFIGAYYDVGNTVAFSLTEYWIEILSRRIHNIHIKGYQLRNGLNSGGEWVDLLDGSINWHKVITALQTAGFDGYLTAEVSKTNANMSYPEFYKQVASDINTILNS
jgi:Sugar phosphate isomerases/epimerases